MYSELVSRVSLEISSTFWMFVISSLIMGHQSIIYRQSTSALPCTPPSDLTFSRSRCRLYWSISSGSDSASSPTNLSRAPPALGRHGPCLLSRPGGWVSYWRVGVIHTRGWVSYRRVGGCWRVVRNHHIGPSLFSAGAKSCYELANQSSAHWHHPTP